MGKFAVVPLLAVIGGCVSVGISSALPVEVRHGDQLKPWGVQADVGRDATSLSGQVTRTFLPKGPLREHVHVELLDAGGRVLSLHDAKIYPVTALRSQGEARLSLTLSASAMANGDRFKVFVVDGAPHD